MSYYPTRGFRWWLRWPGGDWFDSSLTSWTFADLHALWPERDIAWAEHRP